jgi:hypothetical protein
MSSKFALQFNGFLKIERTATLITATSRDAREGGVNPPLPRNCERTCFWTRRLIQGSSSLHASAMRQHATPLMAKSAIGKVTG